MEQTNVEVRDEQASPPETRKHAAEPTEEPDDGDLV
jgi:hypothetical protein